MKNKVISISLSIIFNKSKLVVIEREYNFNPSYIKRTYLKLSQSSYERLTKILNGKCNLIWNVDYLNYSVTIDYLLMDKKDIQNETE